MIAWIFLHALIAIGFALVCHGVGAVALRRVSFDDAALHCAAAAAIGYGLLGQCMFVLGLVGLLNRAFVGALWGAAIVVAIGGLLFRSRGAAHAEKTPAIRRSLLALVGIGSLPAFLIAVYPAIGYDGTMYHLVYARLFADSGRIVFADALRFPVFPQMGEMHFTAAKLLLGDHGMQLTGLLALPVTALAISSIVRQAGGGDRAALFAAALWLGTPYSVYLSGSAYIDVTLTMFVTLAIACTAPSLSGAFAGLAAATKYHGLFFIVTLGFWAPKSVGPSSSAGRRRGSFVMFLAMAALFAVPWYAHIVRATGNPIFPYLRGIFGDHEYRTRIDQTMMRVAADPRRAATLLPEEPPFVSVVRRAITEPIGRGVPPHSPVIVLLLPMVVAAAVIAPRLRRPLIAAAVYALVVSPLDWRFMIVVVPLVAAAIAIVAERLVPRRVTLAVALIFILPGFAWGTLLMAVKFGPLPHTPLQREAFVAERIHVYRAVRSLGPATVYVLHAPNMAYYCPGRCLGDVTGPYGYGKVEPLLHDPESLANRLREFGATHMVVDRKNTTFVPAPPFRLVYSDARADAYAIEFRQ